MKTVWAIVGVILLVGCQTGKDVSGPVRPPEPSSPPMPPQPPPLFVPIVRKAILTPGTPETAVLFGPNPPGGIYPPRIGSSVTRSNLTQPAPVAGLVYPYAVDYWTVGTNRAWRNFLFDSLTNGTKVVAEFSVDGSIWTPQGVTNTFQNQRDEKTQWTVQAGMDGRLWRLRIP